MSPCVGKLFDNEYNDAPPEERVKYGSLNVVRDPSGVSVAAEVYGRSYLQVGPHCDLP